MINDIVAFADIAQLGVLKNISDGVFVFDPGDARLPEDLVVAFDQEAPVHKYAVISADVEYGVLVFRVKGDDFS